MAWHVVGSCDVFVDLVANLTRQLQEGERTLNHVSLASKRRRIVMIFTGEHYIR